MTDIFAPDEFCVQAPSQMLTRQASSGRCGILEAVENTSDNRMGITSYHSQSAEEFRQTLAAAGWAKQDETGKWRLGQKPVQICTNFTWGLTQAKQAVAETEQRYTRTPT